MTTMLRSTTSEPFDLSTFNQSWKYNRVVPFSWGKDKMHWFAKAFCFYMYKSAEATNATSGSLHFWLPPFALLCVLMCSNYSAVNKVYFPINVSFQICLLHQAFPNILP